MPVPGIAPTSVTMAATYGSARTPSMWVHGCAPIGGSTVGGAPSPPQGSLRGGHNLSGSGMLDHRGQLRRPDLPSSFPRKGSLEAGGGGGGRGTVRAGDRRGGEGEGGQFRTPPPPSQGLLDFL